MGNNKIAEGMLPEEGKAANDVNKPKPKKKKSPLFPLIMLVLMTAAASYLGNDLLTVGAKSLLTSYSNAYDTEKDSTYEAWYQKYFDKAEERYHVSNRVAISIGELQETQNLEVLKVSDVEFIIEDKNDNKGNIISWLEVPGEGTYIVNLQAAEFIVDDSHAMVTVRAPYPELTNVVIDYPNVKRVLFEEDSFNGSYKEGEELAQKQLNQADLRIKKEFVSNQHFYLSAQDSARSSIQCLVKQLNPEVSDLKVEVEFY